MRSKLTTLLALAAVAATLAALPARASACTPPDANATPKIQDIGAPALAGIAGHYALPSSAHPTKLVAYSHGYGNISDSWVCHLLDAANNHNAIAFATDYAGTGWTTPGDNRGWFVQEGANEAVAVARYFLARFPSITDVGLLGISMGGNASGLAAAAGAKRLDGTTPLWNWWVDIEGVANLAEEYAIASAVQGANATAAHAVADIDEECRRLGKATQDCLARLTVVNRADEVAASGLKGVVIVHGVDDGLVPTNQSRELSTALRARGLATDQFTVLRRNDGDPGSEGGTTGSGIVADPLFAGAGQRYPAPLAGHGWEGSSTQLVIATGFARLWRLMDGYASDAPANHEFLVDSGAGVVKLA
jgi:hypothetical protein